MLFSLSEDVGVKFDLLEVSDETELHTIYQGWGEYMREITEDWPRSCVVQRTFAGYTDQQPYLPVDGRSSPVLA